MVLPRRMSFSNPVFVTILGAALVCFDTHAFAPREATTSGPSSRPGSNVSSGGGATTEDTARDGTHAGNPSVMPDTNGA